MLVALEFVINSETIISAFFLLAFVFGLLYKVIHL